MPSIEPGEPPHTVNVMRYIPGRPRWILPRIQAERDSLGIARTLGLPVQLRCRLQRGQTGERLDCWASRQPFMFVSVFLCMCVCVCVAGGRSGCLGVSLCE